MTTPITAPVVTPPVAATTGTSTWGSIGIFFSSIGNAIGTAAVKVYEFVKPLFVAIGKFFANMYVHVRDFIAEHKTETIIALVAAGVGAIVYGLSHALCCDKTAAKTATVAQPDLTAEKTSTEKKLVPVTSDDDVSETSDDDFSENQEVEGKKVAEG